MNINLVTQLKVLANENDVKSMLDLEWLETKVKEDPTNFCQLVCNFSTKSTGSFSNNIYFIKIKYLD